MANKGIALVFLALCVLSVPLQWIIAALVAGVVHELSHYLMIKACGGRVTGFQAGIGRATMEARGLSEGSELLCALAGPVGGVCLLLLGRWFPRLAICGALQSIFNLLPIYPLDGGRMLRSCLVMILGDGGERVCHLVGRSVLVILCAIGIYLGFVLRWGVVCLMICGWIVVRAIYEKIPCKAGTYSLQWGEHMIKR
ncbi:MAG: hypothetical protein IJW45_08610 [Oscillospiraceae bacterium]|nr:hypothetical protein [Oscillospiraceae bacterium]